MTNTSENPIDQWLKRLGSQDATERQEARAALVDAGHVAVPQLAEALSDAHQHVRWEAAKSLTAIADPSVVEPLVAALGDEDPDVRWVVGEALIALKNDAVKPLLAGLISSARSIEFLTGAHHVLGDLSKHSELTSLLNPVLEAFNGTEPEVTVPVAAARTLKNSGL